MRLVIIAFLFLFAEKFVQVIPNSAIPIFLGYVVMGSIMAFFQDLKEAVR